MALKNKFQQKYPKSGYALVVLEGLDKIGLTAKKFNMYLWPYEEWE